MLRTLNRNKLVRRTALIIMVTLFVSFGPYLLVKAFDGTMFGRNDGDGYFTGDGISCRECGSGNYVLPEKSDGLAIPDNIDTVPELIQLLKGYNNSNDDQKKTGSAFIYYTMLGKKGSNRDRDISEDDWNALSSRLAARDAFGKIKWHDNIKTTLGRIDKRDSNGKLVKDSRGHKIKVEDKNDTLGRCANSFFSGSKNDDAFYSNGDSCRNDSGIKILADNGDVIYQLSRVCANPMGDSFDVVPEVWSISAESSVKVDNPTLDSPKPGDVIRWTHKLINNGTAKTTKTIHSNLALNGFTNNPNYWGGPSQPEWSAGNTDSGGRVGTIRTLVDYAVYNVRPDDGGNRLCETVQFDPSNSWGGEDSKGNDACIDIPYNYTLTPAVGVDHEYIDTNVDFNVTPRVTNAGPTFSQRSDWKLTQIVMAAGNNLSNTSGGNSFSSPCDYFDPSHISSSCQPALSGNNNTVFDLSGNAVSGDALSTYVGNTGSSAIGTKICYVMSVKSRSSSLSAGEDTRWAHSASRCLIISKNPKVQILSSDLLTRGLVKTSTTDKNVGGIRRFGSWTEYGVLAPGLILGMASGSAYAGSGLVDSALCNYSKLSFANVRLGGAGCENDPVTIGNYNNLSSIPNVAVSFSSSGMAVFDEVVANNLPKNSPDSVTDIYHAVGDLILDASTLSAGRSIVIKVSGTVTITGDQEYNDGPYNRISQIPQLVIIANKIVINSNVTKVNAWLVAHNDAKTGEIYTCQIVGDTASKCKDKLIVNGPVMTDKLYLYRTAGSESGDASGEPAEVFNLRSDAYLWALLQAKNGNHIRTVYTTELPPRY